MRLTPDIGIGVNFIILAHASEAVDGSVVHDLGALSRRPAHARDTGGIGRAFRVQRGLLDGDRI